MQEGTNELVLEATDATTTLSASWSGAVFRATPAVTGLPSSCDITNGVPVAFSASVGTAAPMKVVIWDPAHFTKVHTLWDGPVQQGQPLQLSWAGEVAPAYQYACANGRPASGNYIIRAYTLSDSLGCGGIVSQMVAITNTSTRLPATKSTKWSSRM